ncbi:hypothetical protein [Mycobacteroides abscessus]|uniref:hypothetical protein n=1 Tax=Mycobacteroides abscessus TaxID=36809 RepID=UPI001056E516|nr:hypothetical protein [Mycobacteroides abscessus]
MPDTPVPRPSGSDSEGTAVPGMCPQWCVGGHDDEPEPVRHCSEAVLVPGIALAPSARRDGGGDGDGDGKNPSGLASSGMGVGNLSVSEGCIGLSGGDCAVGVTLSVVLHQHSDSPLVWVYIGDGSPQGLEVSVETAWLLVMRLRAVLGESGVKSI